MATTTWIAGSGDWNTASNWSNGVPGAGDDAVFSTIANSHSSGSYMVGGDGVAASLTIGPDSSSAAPTLTGTYTVGTFIDDRPGGPFVADAGLAATADLLFGLATISGGAELDVATGARLQGGTLTLSNGALVSEDGSGTFGSLGVLTNALVVAGSDTIAASAALSGPISGTGTLHVGGGKVVLSGGDGGFSGGLVVGGAGMLYGDGDVPGLQVELAATGAAGTQPIQLGTGTLTLDAGVAIDTIAAATGVGHSEIDAADQTVTVFADPFPFIYRNGSGHATIIGSTTTVPEIDGDGPQVFGTMTVQGGSGSVTVFGGNEGGLIQGGTAGHNVLVGGANLSAYPAVNNAGFVQGSVIYGPERILLVGGGDGDLPVASGAANAFRPGPYDVDADELVAAGGAETLTGSGSSGRVLFFGGTGPDLIVAGAGQSTIVAETGSATIAGGAGTAAIFAGSGADVILGGAGADYVQAGTGNATLFAGAGADLVGVVDGQAGGSLVLSGFRVGTDRLDLQGYGGGTSGITNSQVVNGNTALTLVDGTRLTLLGVTNLGTSSFV